jgi:hypothetical protein
MLDITITDLDVVPAGFIPDVFLSAICNDRTMFYPYKENRPTLGQGGSAIE